MDYGQNESRRWVYLVRYKGHPPSWQPAADLNLPQMHPLLQRFHTAHPELPPPRPWLKKKTGQGRGPPEGEDEGGAATTPHLQEDEGEAPDAVENRPPLRRSRRNRMASIDGSRRSI